jgi:hypothetical protein
MCSRAPGKSGDEEGRMDKPGDINTGLCLDEWESAQLAHAVKQLVQTLGFPPEDVNRSFRDSFAFFLKNP